jgi:hypothetical protein
MKYRSGWNSLLNNSEWGLFPQGLKPTILSIAYGATKVAPFKEALRLRIFQQIVMPCF